jgi:lysophospholipase L1-like esterase
MPHSRRQFLLAATAAAAATSCSTTSVHARPRAHIVLLGDSIFDNASYVPDKPDVIQQLQQALGNRGTATLLARDGDVTADVEDQLRSVPTDATHLVLSVGGNDALGHIGILNRSVENSSEVFAELAEVRAQFRSNYSNMLTAVQKRGLPTAVCLIYDSNFDGPRKPLADVALTVFNDVILRSASKAGVPVIDLRRIFDQRADYANAIEPSEIGGAKMVRTIVTVAHEHDFAAGRTVLYA